MKNMQVNQQNPPETAYSRQVGLCVFWQFSTPRQNSVFEHRPRPAH